MSFQALRHRFLWRQRAPIGPGEIRRIERWLATARVFLAISALVAIRMDPGEIRYSFWAYGLLAFYIAQGVIVILLLRRREQSTMYFRRLVHAADIVWPALMSIFATGVANPFFLFFVFVLAAAAYRWGVWETVATAASEISLLWLESLAFQLGFFNGVDNLLARYHLPQLGARAVDFEPKRLFMLSIYLLVMGLLLGYLAEQQKRLRSEKAVIARILGKVRVEAGLSGTLQEIVGELLVMYGAERALIASQEATGHRVYVGEMLLRNGEASFFRWLDPLAFRPGDLPVRLSGRNLLRLAQRPDSQTRATPCWGSTMSGQKLPGSSPAILDGLARPARLRQADDGFLRIRKGMVGPDFFPGAGVDGRNYGRVALPAGIGRGRLDRPCTTCTCCGVCACGRARWNGPASPANCTTAPCSR